MAFGIVDCITQSDNSLNLFKKWGGGAIVCLQRIKLQTRLFLNKLTMSLFVSCDYSLRLSFLRTIIKK